MQKCITCIVSIFFIFIYHCFSSSLSHLLNFNSLTITEKNGCAGFNTNLDYSSPGKPHIPRKTVSVRLPADADVSSISVSLNDIREVTLPDKFTIKPTPPFFTYSEQIWPEGYVYINGKDIAVYNSKAFYPGRYYGGYRIGKQRNTIILDITIFPFQYNPVTREVEKLISGTLNITYNKNLPVSTVKNDNAQNNFHLAETYIIVTTQQIISQSAQLSSFIDSKENRGFIVHLIDESQWGGGTGDDAAENLRTWLKENYETMNIKYLLIIGNPNPDNGDVPMKNTHPNSSYVCATDFFYADLSGDWDINNNGKAGELSDYGVAGGIDRYAEIIVGRIPYYGKINDLDKILAKTVRFENEDKDEIGWRKNGVVSINDAGYEGLYQLGESMKSNVFDPNSWGCTRMYERKLQYDPEITPCDEQDLLDAITTTPYGLFQASGHGSPAGMSKIFSTGNADQLDDDHPFFTFISSCSTSEPDDEDNMGYAMLLNGAIATNGATHLSYTSGDISSPAHAEGMSYAYGVKLINEEKNCGDAHMELKVEADPSDGSEWMNFVIYNLYGCPAIGVYTCDAGTDIKVPNQQLRDKIISGQNYPNPFASQTNIRYKLLKGCYVTMIINNCNGKTIRTLVNAKQASGTYKVAWDGCDAKGEKVPAGVYFYRLTSGGHVTSKRMILQK